MTELEISWRGLDPAAYAHVDATAVWGAFAGDELVFVVTEGPAESDQLDDEFDEVENLNDVEGGADPTSDADRVYSTWAVLTPDADGTDGLEPLDDFESLQEAQESVAADLQDLQETRKQS